MHWENDFQDFPRKNVWGANLTLPWKGPRSTYDHHLNKSGRPWVPLAMYQDLASKLSWFRRSQPSCSVGRNHLNKLSIYFRQKAPCEIWWTNCLSSFRKDIQKLHILYMYIAQGQGQITSRGQKFDCNKKVLIIQTYIVSFSHLSLICVEKDISTFSPIKCMGL